MFSTLLGVIKFLIAICEIIQNQESEFEIVCEYTVVVSAGEQAADSTRSKIPGQMQHFGILAEDVKKGNIFSPRLAYFI